MGTALNLSLAERYELTAALDRHAADPAQAEAALARLLRTVQPDAVLFAALLRLLEAAGVVDHLPSLHFDGVLPSTPVELHFSEPEKPLVPRMSRRSAVASRLPEGWHTYNSERPGHAEEFLIERHGRMVMVIHRACALTVDEIVATALRCTGEVF